MDNAVRHFFNQRAEGWMERCWEDYFAGRDPAMTQRLSGLFDVLGITAGARVLDVGCGDGFLVRFLLERLGTDGRLVELDVAEEMIAQNRARHQDARVTFQVADVMSLPPSHAYDAVIAFSCFPHFADQLGVLRVMAAQLVPGGRLGVCHTRSSADMNAFHEKADPAVSKHTLPDGAAMATLFEQAGIHPLTLIDRDGLYLAAGTPGSRFS